MNCSIILILPYHTYLVGLTRKSAQTSAWLDFEGKPVHLESASPWLQSLFDGKHLERVSNSPVMLPDKKDPSEAKYVLNSAVISVERDIILPGNVKASKGMLVQVYRADAKNDVSTLKIATSLDGINWTKHSQAIENPSATIHYEDPRITVMSDGRIVMASTRADKENHIASIDLSELVEGKFIHLCTVNKEHDEDSDKDGVLFPQKINGKYALLRRPWPDIKIAYANSLAGPWDLNKDVIMSPRKDRKDNGWIGGGSVPILTDCGWFMIYHGVEYHGIPENKVYRLFGALLDKDNPADPSKVLRTSNPILEPHLRWEKYGGAVPNVVFSCNSIVFEDALWTWYGAADKVIGAAKRD